MKRTLYGHGNDSFYESVRIEALIAAFLGKVSKQVNSDPSF